MSGLGERVDAAIRASGKTAKEIAAALDVDETTISRIRTGKEDNPKLQLLIGIARETGTALTTLLGGSFEISPALPPDRARTAAVRDPRRHHREDRTDPMTTSFTSIRVA